MGSPYGVLYKVIELMLDTATIRQRFPALHQEVNGHPLVYLDNAATTHKPDSVIQAITQYYSTINSNVHRGVHTLSQRATDAFENARSSLQKFINAESDRQIIFTKGCTEAINLVAQSYGEKVLQAGDQVLVSQMEHHSNMVPWQVLAEKKGAKVIPIPLNDKQELDLAAFRDLLNDKVKIVCIVHVSNSLGTVNPIAEISRLAHEAGARVMVDAAQALSHCTVDVQALDVDFYAMSSHKMYGPTGVGALYAKAELLEDMPPYQSGGSMIEKVSFSGTTFREYPTRFEAGTPNIAGVIALGAAIDFLNSIGVANIARHEAELVEYALPLLLEVKGLRAIGQSRERAGIVSFVFDEVHPHDVGTVLDSEGIAIRTGHHCCMPLMESLNLSATARASFALYNTREEVDALVAALNKVSKVFL